MTVVLCAVCITLGFFAGFITALRHSSKKRAGRDEINEAFLGMMKH